MKKLRNLSLKFADYLLMLTINQVRDFAPIGMMECWNIGKREK
jgi:hypothetical protein